MLSKGDLDNNSSDAEPGGTDTLIRVLSYHLVFIEPLCAGVQQRRPGWWWQWYRTRWYTHTDQSDQHTPPHLYPLDCGQTGGESGSDERSLPGNGLLMSWREVTVLMTTTLTVCNYDNIATLQTSIEDSWLKHTYSIHLPVLHTTFIFLFISLFFFKGVGVLSLTTRFAFVLVVWYRLSVW